MTGLLSLLQTWLKNYLSAPIIWKLTDCISSSPQVEVHHFLSLGGETDSFYQLYFKPPCKFGWGVTLK